MTTPTDLGVELVATAWVRWAEQPSNRARCLLLESACRDLAGAHTTSLRAYMAEAIRTRSCRPRDAVYEWLDLHPEVLTQ